MTTISIIGSGNMATAISTRAAKHGHTIEVMSRDTAKAQALADKIGNGATAGTFGATASATCSIPPIRGKTSTGATAAPDRERHRASPRCIRRRG